MTRGGARPGAGRKPTTGRGWAAGGKTVTVQFSQAERGELEECLRDDETAASLLRDLGLAEVRRRAGIPH